MKKYSNNKKLNCVLNEIEEQLLSISDTEEQSIREIKRYIKEFPRELDHNIYMYGNVLIYYYDIRAMYKRAGYKCIERMSNDKMLEVYKRQIRFVSWSICGEI